jgi:hypothetical protein
MTDAREIAGAREAIDAAIRHFAAIEQSYRNPRGQKAQAMSKSTRQRLAAEYAAWQRDLGKLRAILEEPTP